MKNNRQSRVSFPVFNGYEVRVILSRNMRRTCSKLREKVENADGVFITHKDVPGIGWIVFGENPDEGTIAHEASHAVQELFRWAGVRRDEETYAYHLDFLVARIHKFIKRGKHADILI